MEKHDLVSGKDVIEDLNSNCEEFEKLAKMAENRKQKARIRKDKGFSPMCKTFENSLITLLTEVIKVACDKVRERRSAFQLRVAAERKLEDAVRKLIRGRKQIRQQTKM